ncbi:lysophospholipase I [Trametes punicea]|nr:lysophospholipase I [Trametes punicea]
MATTGAAATCNVVPLVVSPKDQHYATVIFVHGLGQRADSWVPVLQRVIERLPGIKWILPQAPSAPVTYDEGQCRPSWFDISNLPPCNCYDETGVATSVATVESLLTSEVRNGMEPHRIVLAGFSQGAALSFITALTTLHELGGVAGLSGWIPLPSRQVRYQAAAAATVPYLLNISQAMLQLEPNLPVFWAHGKEDMEVPLTYAEDGTSFLRNGLHIQEDKLVFKTYEGLGHAVNDAELDDLARWLSHVLA